MKAAALVVILSWPYWGIEQEGRLSSDNSVMVQGVEPMTDAIGPDGKPYHFEFVDFDGGFRIFTPGDKGTR